MPSEAIVIMPREDGRHDVYVLEFETLEDARRSVAFLESEEGFIRSSMVPTR